MPDTRSIVRRFVAAWLPFLALALIAMAFVGKLELHARINCCHAALLDRFFALITHAADGMVPTGLALVLLFTREARAFLMMGVSAGASALVAQLLKRGFFSDHGRPVRFRDELGAMDWVHGIDLHAQMSFPSGHATAAYSMCLAFAVVLGRRSWAVPLALLAALMAFSRVYLSQHFLADIAAGSVIGALTALGAHHWLYRSSFSGKAWLGRRLVRLQK